MSKWGAAWDEKMSFFNLKNVLAAMAVFILFAGAVGVYIYLSQRDNPDVKPGFEAVYSREEAEALVGDGLPLDVVTEQPGFPSPLVKYSLMYMPVEGAEDNGVGDSQNWMRLDVSVMYSGVESDDLQDQVDLHFYFKDVGEASASYVARMNVGDHSATLAKSGQTVEMGGVTVEYSEELNVHYDHVYVARFETEAYNCYMEAYSHLNPELLDQTLEKMFM